MLLTIVSSKQWTVKITDIKSSFLQGMILERDVYVVPPVEAGESFDMETKPMFIWAQ